MMRLVVTTVLAAMVALANASAAKALSDEWYSYDVTCPDGDYVLTPKKADMSPVITLRRDCTAQGGPLGEGWWAWGGGGTEIEFNGLRLDFWRGFPYCAHDHTIEVPRACRN